MIRGGVEPMYSGLAPKCQWTEILPEEEDPSGEETIHNESKHNILTLVGKPNKFTKVTSKSKSFLHIYLHQCQILHKLIQPSLLFKNTWELFKSSHVIITWTYPCSKGDHHIQIIQQVHEKSHLLAPFVCLMRQNGLQQYHINTNSTNCCFYNIN